MTHDKYSKCLRVNKKLMKDIKMAIVKMFYPFRRDIFLLWIRMNWTHMSAFLNDTILRGIENYTE